MTKSEIESLNKEKASLQDILNILQDNLDLIDVRTNIKIQKAVNTRLLVIRSLLRSTLH